MRCYKDGVPRLGFVDTIGALIIRIGFCGPLYYNHNKEHPKIV